MRQPPSLTLTVFRAVTLIYLFVVWVGALAVGALMLVGYWGVEKNATTVFQQQAAAAQVTAVAVSTLLIAFALDRIGRAIGDGAEKMCN